jgi:hypothetical protein
MFDEIAEYDGKSVFRVAIRSVVPCNPVVDSASGEKSLAGVVQVFPSMFFANELKLRPGILTRNSDSVARRPSQHFRAHPDARDSTYDRSEDVIHIETTVVRDKRGPSRLREFDRMLARWSWAADFLVARFPVLSTPFDSTERYCFTFGAPKSRQAAAIGAGGHGLPKRVENEQMAQRNALNASRTNWSSRRGLTSLEMLMDLHKRGVIIHTVRPMSSAD